MKNYTRFFFILFIAFTLLIGCHNGKNDPSILAEDENAEFNGLIKHGRVKGSENGDIPITTIQIIQDGEKVDIDVPTELLDDIEGLNKGDHVVVTYFGYDSDYTLENIQKAE